MNTIEETNNKAMEGETPPMLAPEAVVEQLRALREQIPEYVHLRVSDAGAIRRAAHVDADFIQAAINTIGASDGVRQALGCTPEVLRQAADEAARWSAVEDELRAMLKGVIASNLVRRHRLGITALQTYNISRQLVRQKDHAYLLPHVDEMKRLNRFGRGRRAKAPVEPVPVPPTVPVQKS